MVAIVQTWRLDGREVMSLSLNKEQLAQAKEEQRLYKKRGEKFATPFDGSYRITIPDNSSFAEMLQGRTVFLESDEEDIVFNALKNTSK